MTAEYEGEYEDAWVVCSKCNELVVSVKYTPGSGSVCKKCPS